MVHPVCASHVSPPRAAVRTQSSSIPAHTGYKVVSHWNSVESTAIPRVTHW